MFLLLDSTLISLVILVIDILRIFYTSYQNVEYRVDLKTRKCNKTTPYREWRERGVPLNAQFMFENVIGAAAIPNEHITVEYYTWNSTDGGNPCILVVIYYVRNTFFTVGQNSSSVRLQMYAPSHI